MRTGYLASLVFALLTSLSISTNATSSPKFEAGTITSTPEVSPKVQSAKIDLNKADAAALQRDLIGIGEKKAQEIISYRDINGPYRSVDELLEVKGIGKVILEKNRERLLVN
ncbi:ComEA family DNA-binding protein [Pseudomonas sp. Ant30-3]|uniref:ComEA family DNA-binding protein n=1 Tax=Pseudomonas sp. Ant30-3 TaxID=1488328 RepID=UPI00049043C1|nr:helix-hairpin-helix domain-containing protein [Pseudomonas sp. Ant30-3]